MKVADATVADVSFILTLYKFKLNVFLEMTFKIEVSFVC